MQTSFGALLRKRREDLKLTRDELSKKCGFSSPTLYRWEKGERQPRKTDIEKLASALGVSVSYLIGEVMENSTSVDIKGSNISGVTTLGNGTSLGRFLSSHESPMVLIAHAIEIIEKNIMKSHEIEAVQSMLKSGLETLESKKEEQKK